MSFIRLSMIQMNRRFILSSATTNQFKWFSSKSGKVGDKITAVGKNNGAILSQSQIDNKLSSRTLNGKEFSTKPPTKTTKKAPKPEKNAPPTASSPASTPPPVQPEKSASSVTPEKPTPPAPPKQPTFSPPPQTTSSSSSSGSSNEESSNKLWFAVAAAALIGGGYLVYYSNTKKSPDTPIVDAPKKTVVAPKPRIPLTSAEIPKEVPYLLIGGGTASFAAFRAIKSHEPKARVMVISNEIETPYMRPPLSKELWLSHLTPAVANGNKTKPIKTTNENPEELKFKQWNGVERSLYYEPNDFYIHPTQLNEGPNGGVAIVRGYTVDRIDVAERKAILTDGTEIKYGECLIATGSLPKNLKVFETAPRKVQDKFSLFKSIEDFKNLKEVVDQSKSIAIVGGGFLGSELACSLARYGASRQTKVQQIFNENGNMGRVLPEFLSKWTTERVREEGVNVIPNAEVQSVDLQNNQLRLHLTNGDVVLCDHAVVAVGSEPRIELARKSGLEIDDRFGGYLVNAELEARKHLYVAGDAACFYDTKLGRRRVEHHDHAVVSGRLAGENMVGLKKPYSHQSMFWSDLGPKVGYEAIGIIDSTLPTVSVFAKRDEELNAENSTSENLKTEKSIEQNREIPDDFSKGIVFYLRDEKIVGIVLWNVFNRINKARAIIAEDKKFDDLNEVAKLFGIHT